MVSKPKSTTSRKTGTRARKPATIDLEAKKTPGDTASNTADAETTQSNKSTSSTTTKSAAATFGRPANKASTTASKSEQSTSSAPTSGASTGSGSSAKKETDKTTKSPADSEPKNPQASAPKKSGGGLFSGLVGAGAAIAGLGAIGQLENAGDIPFIGKLYSSGSTEISQSLTEADLQALQQQISELEADNARIAELETTLANLQASANAGDDGLPVADPAVTNRIVELETRITELAASNGQTEAPDLSPITERLAGIEEQVSQLRSIEPTDTSALEARLTQLETSLGEVTATVTALNDQSSDLRETVASVRASETVARSVAVNALGAALENDDPVTLSIASVESLGGSGPETERLTELAREGIPTRAVLLSELALFTNAIQNPTAQAPQGSLSERFWANAQNLVSFRSSGPQEGTAPVAILSRVKAAIETGNLTQAKTEWQLLPSEIQADGEAWVSLLDKRMEAFSLYQALSDKFTSQDG